MLSLLFCSLVPAMAQRKIQQLDEDEARKQEQLKAYERSGKGFSADKFTFGGNAGLSMSGGYTYFLAQPLVGYKVKPGTIPGVGFTYIYLGYKGSAGTYSTNAYGPIVFLRQHLLEQVFAYAEYQPINYSRQLTLSKPAERVWENQLFVGGGVRSGPALVYVLYNVLYDSQTSFFNSSPWYFRVGFFF